jgi:hypothetical protein
MRETADLYNRMMVGKDPKNRFAELFIYLGTTCRAQTIIVCDRNYAMNMVEHNNERFNFEVWK